MTRKQTLKRPVDHKHDFHFNPGLLGISCLCGVSRFGTRFGNAEYDPKSGKTTQLSTGKILYEKQS